MRRLKAPRRVVPLFDHDVARDRQALCAHPVEACICQGRVAEHAASRPGVSRRAPALALELAPVRVNAVTPGLIDTPLLHTAYGVERDAIVNNRAAILPGKRVGTADEVAQVIVLLMTNNYVTGEVMHVDGSSRFV
jgi:NAD(P)-dependent dehydrogenase (short-subunit alcohol dehydrogenase family)